MMPKCVYTALFFSLICLPSSAVRAADIDALVIALGSQNKEEVEKAIEGISDLGSRGTPAIGALIKLLANPDAHLRAHAAIALGGMGKAAMPAAKPLAKLMADKEVSVRHASLEALAEIQPGPEMVVPLMLEGLQDQNEAVVKRAIHALAERGEAIVPAMIEALKDDRTEFYALLVLHEIGPQAKAAVPAICEILHEQHEPYQRQEAALTLGMIGPGAAAAVPDLITLLDDSETGVQHAAVFALGMIGPPAAPAAEAIREHLELEDPFFWVAGAWALAKIFPENENIEKTAARFLAQMLTDPDEHVRRMAAQALLDMEPGLQITLPALEAALANADPKVVDDALIAIAGLGKAAVPILIKALEQPESRSNVAHLARHLGEVASPAVPALIAAYSDEQDPQVRTDILFALGEMGPKAKGAIDVAIEGCSDEDQGLRYASFYLLGRVGPEAMKGKDALKSHLDDEDEYYAATAAWALARIDEDDPDVVAKGIPLFVKALKNPQAFVRHEAADSLAELGPLAKPAIPELEQAAKDPDPSVAEAAKAAIKKIRGS